MISDLEKELDLIARARRGAEQSVGRIIRIDGELVDLTPDPKFFEMLDYREEQTKAQLEEERNNDRQA